MLEGANVAGTPAFWLKRLGNKLDGKRERYDILESYFRGDHPLPEGDRRCRELFRRFQRTARTNYVGLVAESVRERLRILGFRTGSTGDDGTDADAWRIWQANNLDMESGIVHVGALVLGDYYVMVGPDTDDPMTPLITPEDPREVIAECDPTNRKKLRAGLKMWMDEIDGVKRAEVYLPNTANGPGGVHYFRTIAGRNTTGKFDAGSWEPAAEPGPNPLGEVPLVHFVNRPFMQRHGFGEFEDAIDVQNRINNSTLDRLIIAKMQAYHQRIIKGMPTTDEDGNELDLPFVPGVDLLWVIPDADVQVQELQTNDLTPILNSIKDDVQALVVLTGLPPHYVAGGLVNASAEALAAAEARLVSKVRERQREYDDPWENVVRLGFKVIGDPRGARIVDSEVLWADPERHSIAQMADAAVKAVSAGVPWRQRMADLGYSPQQIDRLESQRAQDALLSATLAPLAVAEGGQVGSRGMSFGVKTAPENEAVPPVGVASSPAGVSGA